MIARSAWLSEHPQLARRSILVSMERVDLGFPIGNVVIAFVQARLLDGLATHQLRISAKVSATWLDNKASQPLLLTSRVSSDHGVPRYVGDLAGVALNLRSYPLSEEFCLALSDAQVHALEREREAGDLRLRLDLSGTLLSPPGNHFPTATSQVAIRIPESTWTQDLDQVGQLLALTIRVPSRWSTPVDTHGRLRARTTRPLRPSPRPSHAFGRHVPSLPTGSTRTALPPAGSYSTASTCSIRYLPRRRCSTSSHRCAHSPSGGPRFAMTSTASSTAPTTMITRPETSHGRARTRRRRSRSPAALPRARSLGDTAGECRWRPGAPSPRHLGYRLFWCWRHDLILMGLAATPVGRRSRAEPGVS